MMLDHVELVQQGDVGRGDLGYEQIGIIRQKGVGGWLRSLRRLFLCQGREDSHLKRDAALLNYLGPCGDGLDRATASSLRRAFEQGLPQGAGLQETIVLTHMKKEEYVN